ncbi:MAG: cyanophycinase, partial [Acidobacteriota bacterium]
GGTSAGAAVMSELMITGNEKIPVEDDRAFVRIMADNIEVIPGLGFIKTAIIDQHFVTRKRHNRLISLVLENKDLLGIGIDESTAIIVKPGGTFEVVGEQNVIVYDASKAAVEIRVDKIMSGHNIVMHVLKPGDKFDLKTKEPI